jgi:hypothetical protein
MRNFRMTKGSEVKIWDGVAGGADGAAVAALAVAALSPEVDDGKCQGQRGIDRGGGGEDGGEG